jgi:Bacterial PH domain
MITEYENEPIPGLPGLLPEGERILWQGSPEWRKLATTAFHTRLIAGYFALLVVVAVVTAFVRGGQSLADFKGIAITVVLGAIGVGLLNLIAWATARATIYTLTNRRIVMRVGIALPKCINLPLGLIESVDLLQRPDGTGDLPLKVTGGQRIGYAGLWPHARPWHYQMPQPMLRSIANADSVASLVARTCLAANPGSRLGTIEPVANRQQPSYGEPSLLESATA